MVVPLGLCCVVKGPVDMGSPGGFWSGSFELQEVARTAARSVQTAVVVLFDARMATYRVR